MKEVEREREVEGALWFRCFEQNRGQRHFFFLKDYVKSVGLADFT